ncbi:MAG: anti-sigma F factor [Oscillospiraceae bacterium]
MNIINEIKVVFPSKSCNESFARMCIASFVAKLDPAVSELAEIKTAVSEAVTNAIVHGYRNSYGNIELTAKAYEDKSIVIKIKDKGCGIPDIAQAMTPLFTTAPEEERAGLGFAVMESFMDKVSVKSSPGVGTTVTLRRKITSCAEDPT